MTETLKIWKYSFFRMFTHEFVGWPNLRHFVNVDFQHAVRLHSITELKVTLSCEDFSHDALVCLLNVSPPV